MRKVVSGILLFILIVGLTTTYIGACNKNAGGQAGGVIDHAKCVAIGDTIAVGGIVGAKNKGIGESDVTNCALAYPAETYNWVQKNQARAAEINNAYPTLALETAQKIDAAAPATITFGLATWCPKKENKDNACRNSDAQCGKDGDGAQCPPYCQCGKKEGADTCTCSPIANNLDCSWDTEAPKPESPEPAPKELDCGILIGGGKDGQCGGWCPPERPTCSENGFGSCGCS